MTHGSGACAARAPVAPQYERPVVQSRSSPVTGTTQHFQHMPLPQDTRSNIHKEMLFILVSKRPFPTARTNLDTAVTFDGLATDFETAVTYRTATDPTLTLTLL